MIAERALRAVALLIAVVAVIDPALTRAAQDRPTVVVLHASGSDRNLALDVVAALQPTFDVSRADVPAAAAYVVAGANLPEGWRPPTEARVFAVTPAAGAPAVKILRLAAPAGVSVDSIAPIDVELLVDGTGDREVTVSLIADGVRLSQAPHRLTGSDTRLRAPLSFVPSQPGIVRLRIEATMTGREPAVADRALEVNSRVWQVLAFDGRPSYAATFVRRALESDPRFKVATRVLTSSLAEPASLAAFDLIIVGATEAFDDLDASSLQRYLRERHGAVVLLPETTEGALLSRLTGQSTWQEDRRLEPVTVTPLAAASPGGSEVWTAAEFLWPARWPPLAETLATITQPSQASAPRPAVWQMPVGGGRLAVSSAIDGWRSRAGASAGFSAFWRATAAALAQGTPPAIDVVMPRRLLTPGQWGEVSVGMFAGGEPAARVKGPLAGESAVRLWPVASPGTGREWSGTFRAPEAPGRYRLEVDGGAGGSGVAEFLIVAEDGVGGHDAPVPPALEHDGLSALAASAHRGTVVPADQLPRLPAQISQAVTQGQAREAWHPMRSLWWLMPFTLCAAGEWWLRRHRGER